MFCATIKFPCKYPAVWFNGVWRQGKLWHNNYVKIGL